ncbi:MAG: hypothetical protein WBH90_13415 [Aggregatilineales bacterium]|nr:NERD domain-containing protein [Chloroflexota bacterium]HOA22872.1 hypothetical protein [Aggregatilineales bacterium]HPV08425.1 hypothetical protein [Aggregatilineales bacterium]HQE18880.1 hypothetical protein [Aggregatilineales bacterium]
MKVYINEQKMRRKRLQQGVGVMLTTTLVLVGLFTVALTVVFFIVPGVAGSPFLIVALGLISTFIGLQAGGQISRLPEPHNVLSNGLKGVGAAATLYHYYLPADHVLVTPKGVFTLTPIRHETRVTFNHDGDYRTHDSFLKRVMHILTRQQLGHPIHTAQQEAARVRNWLTDNLGTDAIDVHPILVFLHSDAEFEVEGEPSVPILRADKRKPSLKSYMKDYQQAGSTLTEAQIDKLNEILNVSQ